MAIRLYRLILPDITPVDPECHQVWGAGHGTLQKAPHLMPGMMIDMGYLAAASIAFVPNAAFLGIRL